jgi:hypothetical protein
MPAKKTVKRVKAKSLPGAMTVRSLKNEAGKERWDGQQFRVTVEIDGREHLVTGMHNTRDRLKLIADKDYTVPDDRVEG